MTSWLSYQLYQTKLPFLGLKWIFYNVCHHLQISQTCLFVFRKIAYLLIMQHSKTFLKLVVYEPLGVFFSNFEQAFIYPFFEDENLARFIIFFKFTKYGNPSKFFDYYW